MLNFEIKTALETEIHKQRMLICIMKAFRNHQDYEDQEIFLFGDDVVCSCSDLLVDMIADSINNINGLFFRLTINSKEAVIHAECASGAIE